MPYYNMVNIFEKGEIVEILSNYNIGKFKKFGKIKKDDVVSFGQVIKTSKGIFFMKVLRTFNDGISQSISICDTLQKKGFPTYRTYKTKSKKIYSQYKDNKIVFYEFIPNLKNKWKNLSIREIRNFGKTLAKFHKLTKSIKIKPTAPGTHEDIVAQIHRYFLKRKKFGQEIQDILSYMEREIRKIKYPKNQYLTGYYSEFNPGHVIFEKNRVRYVIDWEIGKTNAFFDYGSSMSACFNLNGKRLSSKKLKSFIIAYDRERKLSSWEKDNLFEAFKFGVLKYGIWGFVDLKKGCIVCKEKDIDKEALNRVKFLMSSNKISFNKIINIS